VRERRVHDFPSVKTEYPDIGHDVAAGQKAIPLYIKAGAVPQWPGLPLWTGAH
jgi:hypothetical protein